jgi:hypothetical protein
MSRPRFALLATVGAALLLASCSSSNDATPIATTTAKPTAVASVARIVSLTGPPSPVQCNSPTSVELHFETKNAASVELRINGGSFATYPSGRHDVLAPLACDGNTQKYELTARDAHGASVSKTLSLAERAVT